MPQYEPIVEYTESLRVTPPEQRIANGHAAAANQFPHQVAVRSPSGAGQTTCGGSLISQNWVLTAAHCTVGRSQFNLRFGSLNVGTGGIAQTTFTVVNHPSYNPVNLNNDVSVIQTAAAVALSPAVGIVRLAAASQVGTTFVNLQTTVSGWGETAPGSGVTTLLRWVHMRVISNAQCAGVYGTSAVVAHVICTLGYAQPQNQGACGGDSGGPLTISEGGVPTHIGVVAFAAAAGCNVGLPTGYMRTASFVHWINQHTGIAVRP